MRVLDLFCGVGGASEGYRRAGADVIVGVDIEQQPNYPFPFLLGDAFSILEGEILNLNDFDLIHASPPCQTFSWGTRKGREEKYPDQLSRTIKVLQGIGIPWVVENIPNSGLSGTRLCGTQFNLPLLKHRIFAASFPIPDLPHAKHIYGGVGKGIYMTVAGHGGNNKSGNYGVPAWRRAMDMGWPTTRHELAEAIPPAYTEYVGRAFLRHRG
jgi:DNA (cytosine-5)-methyltransferase 1